MKLTKKTVAILIGWLACLAMCGVGWEGVLWSMNHDGLAFFPFGIRGLMWCLSGLAVGLAVNGIAGAVSTE